MGKHNLDNVKQIVKIYEVLWDKDETEWGMQLMKIAVLLPVREKHRRLLEERAPKAEFLYESLKTLNIEHIKDADIIIGNPPIKTVRELKNLKWLQLQSAGVGEYADPGILSEDVLLTNASGAYGHAISEHMLGVLLELYKKLHIYRDQQNKSQWSYAGKVRTILGSTALIVGLGDIGGEFAARLKALGAYTIGIKRKASIKPDYLDELHMMDMLEALLPCADIVALSLPETPQTRNIINRDRIQLMKQDAVLINVGRGNAVDTEALCDALVSGRLWGAALDVTDPEPLPKEHRLWSIQNAVITPHVSGGFSLELTFDKIIGICAANLEAYMGGWELSNLVDRSAGY
jgi:phosphoglycerate dehydrogenase-like enzyme